MAHPSAAKGARVEREMVKRHLDIGIYAERVDARLGQFSATKSHDIDVYARGRDEAPLCGEIKARKDGAGFATLERWLGDNDFLILRRNNADPIVVVPWAVWAEILRMAK
jgi:hypothetical protein